jgi:hypothetical protein
MPTEMEEVKEKKVEITEKEYKQLKKDSKLLECLDILGVDNWIGYEDAHKRFEVEEGEA